ncbi:cation-translocating P-type ATPase [Clostridium sp. NSJ-6]|uniref:Cation-translocating P-type ATPase n=1 Tax=Clostridium hominis TaxID=2763036 RepID=A0ABR7DAF9_9CLOT|nr:cation-translocating P-type ATPase [Clostridium hominis]MBC5628381.1 cation-translocating P-type ATPase [Clostridium hominis]MDU2671152.1 cation-translocating P-type ATPase [Clostridium sp.]
MYSNEPIDKIISHFDTNITNGLSSKAAEELLSKNGKNKLIAKKKKTLLELFLSQINDVMIYILIAAALISALVGEVSDSIIIVIVILINAIIGVVQENKAEKALEALKSLSTPKALVKRDGNILEIPSEDVVLGDLVIIDAGRYIPADLRLIESINLKVDESAFTGESLPAEKDSSIVLSSDDVAIGDKSNMAFMSTLATYGRGSGIVVSTGMDTEIGKIAKMLDTENDNITPLQKNLAHLGKILGIGAVSISILMFIISMFQGRDFLQMFMTSISLAVAAIPEGLPATVAIVLALGVQRMSKENAIIRKLPAVETLGSVNIICSDKTGTLTLNKMTVKKAFVNNISIDVNELNLNKNEDKILVEGMILCNDATSIKESKSGDPTEIALLDVGNKFNILKDSLNLNHKRVNEIPFDSERKLMTTVNLYENKYRVFTKGAIDNILKLSTQILKDDKVLPLNDEEKKLILTASNKMSDSALRVLALAYKDTKDPSENSNLEDNLTFVGFMGMIDPPRKEVKNSIATSKAAGIRTVMITGDHKNTAFAIGNELGIANNISEALSGSEIDSYSQEEFNKIVNTYNIFARVSPEHKVKIVKALKSHGNIVSMTGDGVNDAPSLKFADIGVAMGITGTDVAKGAADMILTDDNFSTIVKAIEEGRNIFNNIKKSIVFLLSSNLGEVITLFTAILLNWASPLLPIHILWINLITDSLPALALGVDPKDPNVMSEPPRNPKDNLFSNGTGVTLILLGILIGFTTLLAFKVGEYLYPNSLAHAQTMSFVVLSGSQLILSLSMRSEKESVFKIGIFKNKKLLGAIFIGILLQISIISIPPIARIFNVFSLTLKDWLFVSLLAMIPFTFFEISKLFRKK